MKNTFYRILATLIILATSTIGPQVMAQNSAPAPGSGGGFTPSGGGFGGFNPGPPPPPNWGGPWGPGWGATPPIIVSNDWTNSGTEKVMACGYDIRGVWRVLPLRVQYYWNGVQYNVTVLNAWDPWTDMWNRNVDAPAYNTSYVLNGTTFNFYTVLSTGTYYFNL